MSAFTPAALARCIRCTRCTRYVLMERASTFAWVRLWRLKALTKEANSLLDLDDDHEPEPVNVDELPKLYVPGEGFVPMVEAIACPTRPI